MPSCADRALNAAPAFGMLLVAAWLGLWGIACSAARAEDFQTIAPYAILVDGDTGSVLFEKNADALVSPASTAKIMTAEIVFHEIAQGRLSLDDTFVISENAWRRGGATSGGSSMFAVLNSSIRVEDLIRGLLIVSGNDAAIALAEGVAGSESNFGGLMTRRARELGMTRSSFVNPVGIGDPNEKVTAREMTTLASHMIEAYPQYYKYFGERDFTWNKIHQANRNPLLTMNIGADGLKTGDIEEIGYGLVGSAVQNGQRLILVVNGLRTARDRASESFKLLSWGFRAFESRALFASGEVVGSARVYGGASESVPLAAERPIKLLVPRGSTEKLTGKIVYQGPLRAPLAKETEVAQLKVVRGSTEVLTIPLRTTEDVPVGSLPRRAYDAGLELATAFIRQNFHRP